MGMVWGHTLAGRWVSAWDVAVLVQKQLHALLLAGVRPLRVGALLVQRAGPGWHVPEPNQDSPPGKPSFAIPGSPATHPPNPALAPRGTPQRALPLWASFPSGGPLLTVPTAQLLGFRPDLLTPNTVVHLMVPPLPPKLPMAPRCPQFRAQILVPEPILSLALPTSFFNGILRLLLTCQVSLSAFVFGEDSTSHPHLPGNLP